MSVQSVDASIVRDTGYNDHKEPTVTGLANGHDTALKDPGESRDGAEDLGSLGVGDSVSASNAVGSDDEDDYYAFSLDEEAQVRLDLTDMSADADVRLLDSSGEELATSDSSSERGGGDDSLAEDTLAAGTYYADVQFDEPRGEETDFDLSVEADSPHPTFTPTDPTVYIGARNIMEDLANHHFITVELDNTEGWRDFRSQWNDEFEIEMPELKDVDDDEGSYEGFTINGFYGEGEEDLPLEMQENNPDDVDAAPGRDVPLGPTEYTKIDTSHIDGSYSDFTADILTGALNYRAWTKNHDGEPYADYELLPEFLDEEEQGDHGNCQSFAATLLTNAGVDDRYLGEGGINDFEGIENGHNLTLNDEPFVNSNVVDPFVV